MSEEKTMFRSELEKQVWIGVYTRYERNGRDENDRMRAAFELVLELRKSLDELLAFGAWRTAAAEILGEKSVDAGAAGSVFRNEIEQKIWVSAFTRPTPDLRNAKDRAKRAWELVLGFRKIDPEKAEADKWEDAVRELAK